MTTQIARSLRIIRKTAPVTRGSPASARKTAHARPCKGSQRPGLTHAVNDSRLFGWIGALNEAVAPDQEWFRVAPFGEHPNRVGIQVLDRDAAEAMVGAFNSLVARAARNFRGLPIYVGHPDEPNWAKQNPTVRAEAVGRIRELQVRDDGLWAKHALNDDGKRLLSGEAAPYAFQSPHWGMVPVPKRAKAFRPVELYSVGLTNQPNIPGTAIGVNESVPGSSTSMNTEAIRKLLAALGITLGADATEAQVSAAINEATTKGTALVAAQNELGTVKTQLTTAQNEATAAKADATALRTQLGEKAAAAVNERTARAKLVLDAAVASGRVTAAKRGEYEGKLVAAANDTAFAAVETEIKALKPAVNTQAKTSGLGGRRTIDAGSQGRIAAINTAVAKYRTENGCDHHTAFCAVKAAQPDLFTATNAE